MSGETGSDLIVRQAARVLLLDPEERVLLFHCRDPADGREFWVMPGGGVEQGESFKDAAHRELYEETGLTWVTLSGCVWTRTHGFTYREQRYRQHERFFVARLNQSATVEAMVQDLEMQDRLGHRWWSAPELEASAESFAPRRLPALLPPLLAGEWPDEPIDTGI